MGLLNKYYQWIQTRNSNRDSGFDYYANNYYKWCNLSHSWRWT